MGCCSSAGNPIGDAIFVVIIIGGADIGGRNIVASGVVSVSFGAGCSFAASGVAIKIWLVLV